MGGVTRVDMERPAITCPPLIQRKCALRWKIECIRKQNFSTDKVQRDSYTLELFPCYRDEEKCSQPGFCPKSTGIRVMQNILIFHSPGIYFHFPIISGSSTTEPPGSVGV